tara:strand:- start:6059 stop:6901 length:843 start_codon:yes stop_codon:yes gene_type:complete
MSKQDEPILSGNVYDLEIPMEEIIEDFKETKTTKKTREHKYFNVVLKHGDEVECNIQGQQMKGKLCIEANSGNAIYICQNKKNGSAPYNLLGYRYAWHGTVISRFKIDSDIRILNVNGIEVESLDNIKWDKSIKKQQLDYNSNVFSIYINYSAKAKINNLEVIINKSDVLKDISHKKSLFKLVSHGDCCGIKMLYNFSWKEYGTTSYDSLTPEDDLGVLKCIFDESNRASKMAHLTDQQSEQIRFVKRLGFKKIHTFKNANGGNIINVFQLDYKDVNLES